MKEIRKQKIRKESAQKKRKKGRGQPTCADPGPKPAEPAQGRNRIGTTLPLSPSLSGGPHLSASSSPPNFSHLSGYLKRPEITLPLNPPLTLPVSP
jgi:hypothetical protein